MSSILDALKKSDARRPRKNHGQKIRLDINQQPDKNNRRYFYTITLLLLLILAAVYFQKPDFIWQQPESAGHADQQLSPETDHQTAGAEQAPKTQAQTAEKPKKIPKPAPEKVQSMVQEKSTSTNTDDMVGSSHHSAAQKTQPTIIYQEDQPSASQSDDTAEKNLAEPIQTDPDIGHIDEQLADTPMKNKQVLNGPLADKTQNQTPASDLPQLFQLPYAVRKELPQLNLSVHVYDPEVDNRMAIINGIPIRVGDTLDDAISVQDITQSGVVLRAQGQDFIVLK